MNNDIITPLDKAAIVLMSLGTEDAANIMKHMGPKQVQRVGTAMATVTNVGKEKLNSILDEFIFEVNHRTNLGIGSNDYIRSVLVNALGSEKADSVIDRILLNTSTKGLDTLKWMEPKAVADIIKNEHPQIQSIVLSYLDSDQAAEVMSHLAPEQRLDVIMRIASLESVQPSALTELNRIMEKQFLGGSGGKSTSVGGIKNAADIMNFLDSNVEEELMEKLKEENEVLSEQIQDLMFVFENLIEIDDRGMQSLLREVSSDVLILALRGAESNLKDKIFNNMSKRAAELMKDDMEAQGPVKVSEVEAAQKEILTIARKMADAGEIVLGGRGGEEMI